MICLTLRALQLTCIGEHSFAEDNSSTTTLWGFAQFMTIDDAISSLPEIISTFAALDPGAAVKYGYPRPDTPKNTRSVNLYGFPPGTGESAVLSLASQFGNVQAVTALQG